VSAPIEIIGKVTGVEQVVGHMRSIGMGFSQRVPMTVKALGIELQRRVREVYLLGPRPQKLARKTGRLSRSINEKMTEPEKFTYVSTVGTNVKYGAYWEKGFDMKVGAYTRGGRRALSDKVRAWYEARHPAGTKHIEARPFLVPALDDMRAEIRERLVKALSGVK
jgi:hypothetical protein